MITDIFSRRYPDADLKNIGNAFFVQISKIYDDHHLGIRKALLEKVPNYKYSGYADEHIRIIAQALNKICTELGIETLDKPAYQTLSKHGYNDYRIFQKYIFDTEVDPLEKLSFLEILFRDAESHLLDETSFIEKKLPEYQARSEHIKNLSEEKKTKFHNDGEENIASSIPVLESKKSALTVIRTEVNQRAKMHSLDFSYHNGFFQKSDNPAIEEKIMSTFWELVSKQKYKNIETDMLKAYDLYDSNDRDAPLYAAKALESMLKIVCLEKNFTSNSNKPAGFYLDMLNKKENGPVILNEEKEELVSMFRIRNSHGHGPGENPMPSLTAQQTIRYINASAVWVVNLSKR